MAEVKPVPDGYGGVIPYLNLQRAEDAIDFYKTVFGAEEQLRQRAPDGRLLHAEVRINGALVMISEAMRDPPQTAILTVYTRDVDALFARAVGTGAEALAEPDDMPWGDRMARLRDPFGVTWQVVTHIEDVPREELDARMAKAFAQMSET